MKKNVYILIIIFLFVASSCRKEVNNPLDGWFQDPPVAPITQTIKTIVPVGYAASVVTNDIKGLKSGNVKKEIKNGVNVLTIGTDVSYPYKFKGDSYGDLVVAYVQTDENTALVSVLFTDLDISQGSFRLENIVAFPITYDEAEDKTTAVYASIDININSISGYGLEGLSGSEINEGLGKLNNERVYNTTDTDIAVAQNAWIIDVYHKGTYNDLDDDEFRIFGGQQAIEAQDFETESSAGVLQMAMVDVHFSADCIKNPSHGYAFMQDVEVSTSVNNNDIVFGHVLYEFHKNCDGDVVVDFATGNFLFAISKQIDLGLY